MTDRIRTLAALLKKLHAGEPVATYIRKWRHSLMVFPQTTGKSGRARFLGSTHCRNSTAEHGTYSGCGRADAG